MNTLEILVVLVSTAFVLLAIGLILKLLVIGRVTKLERELQKIYGEEHDIKKRIEQYVARKASDELTKATEGYREGLDKESQVFAKQMEEATKAHIDSLSKFILQQEGLITRQAEYVVGSIIKNAQSEVAAYKKNQMEGIDEAVKEIVEKVAPEVLGKSISIEDHVELVWKSLEKAKKEGLFVGGVGNMVSDKVNAKALQKKASKPSVKPKGKTSK